MPVQAVEALRVARGEDPTFSDIRRTDGGKVASPTRLVLISLEGESTSGHSAAGRIR
jgi:hypothetical protein